MDTNPTTTRVRGCTPLPRHIRTFLGTLLPSLLASALPWTWAAPARAQAAGGPAPAQSSKGSSRERSGLAEDQALLQRQLARLRQTMEVLATRFEAEGRTHAAKLLREGLSHLGERAPEQNSKTVDELMGGARSSLESGQTVQAIEVQESVVRSLEKLYSILTDRQGLDDLEHSLDALRKIKADLASLADREKDLREKTSALDQNAATPERHGLGEAIQKAIAVQRELLSRTETQARENGEMELDAIARELEALAARQATDTAVLESWKPEERSALEAASVPLDQAAERATAAQRLAQAARELREAAAVAGDPKGDLATAERELEASAAREERRERAAGEKPATREKSATGKNSGGNDAKPGTDSRASQALRAGSQALSQAPATQTGRENAARSIEEQAAALEKAAETELAAARAAREAAQSALDPLAERKTAAGAVAQRARDALPGTDSSKTGADAAGLDAHDKKLEERAEAERRADAEAGRALSAGLDEQATLPKALSASQAGAAEDAARLERALGARPEGQTSPGGEARKDLTAAAGAQKAAEESASKGDASQAASAARSAQESLASALEALARVRAAGATDSPKTEAERALAREQEDLAKSVGDLERQAESGASTSAKASPDSPDPSQGASSSPQGSPSSSRGSPSSSQGSRDPAQGSPDPSQSSPTPSQGSQGSKETDAKSSLSAAKGAMQSASKSLKQGGASSASSAQREAIARLQAAAEAARKGGALTRPEDQEEAQTLSKEQEKIRNELLELSRRNQKRDTAKPSPSLSQAGSSASKAKEALDEGDMDRAEGSEEDAERQMREALSQLSEEEEQYQKLRAEELLFKVAEQVKGMLEAHRDLMRETIEVDGARQSGEPATHTQRLRLRKISKSEEVLASRASEVGKAIRAEESLVFAEVLDEAGRDLTRTARDLGDDGGYQSGERVQALQQDVEQGLAWLYEALQVEKERRRQEESQSGNQSSQQRGRNRLVPDAAELKLLRQLEVENLDSLEKFKAAHPEIPERGDPGDRDTARPSIDPMVLEDLGRLANRHQRTSDLFEKFRKRLGLPDPPSQEP